MKLTQFCSGIPGRLHYYLDCSKREPFITWLSPQGVFFSFAPFYRFHWDKCYLYPMKKDGLSFKKERKKKVNELSWFIFKQVIFHTLACLEQSWHCPETSPWFPQIIKHFTVYSPSISFTSSVFSCLACSATAASPLSSNWSSWKKSDIAPCLCPKWYKQTYGIGGGGERKEKQQYF